MRRLGWIALVTTSFWLAACAGSVMNEYEAARDAALAAPSGVPSSWKPDMVLHLSPDQVDDIVTAVLEEKGDYQTKIERSALGLTLTATPTLKLDSAKLGASKACDACIAVDLALSGDVKWAVANRKGSVPVKAKAKLDAEFVAVEESGVFSVTVAPRDLRDLQVNLGDLDATIAGSVEKGLGEWLREDFLDQVKPFEVAELGGSELPLRAVRLHPQPDGALAIAMLSRSPSPGVVEVAESGVQSGFLLEISQDSLLDLAKAASFAAGPVGYEVVVEPTSLAIDGDAFTMGLRFWRPVGKGWWRDYTVAGQLAMNRRGVQLVPKDVVEGEKSPGATLVDPLAALAEGYILGTIEQSVATTLPGRTGTTTGGMKTTMKLSGVEGRGDRLVATGTIEVEQAVKGTTGSGTGSGRRR